MGPISWIIFGALAGWIASLISGRNDRQGCLMNIAVGIAGALIGGFLWRRLVDGSFETGFNIGSLIVAVIGALLVTWLLGLVTRAE